MPIRTSLDWIKDRIKYEHHKALTRYLLNRTPEEIERDNQEDITINSVLKDAFNVKNGMTNVPKFAMQLLRSDESTSPELVWQLCYKSPDPRQRIKCVELMGKLSEKRPNLKKLYNKAKNLLIVERIMNV